MKSLLQFTKQFCVECGGVMWPSKLIINGWYCPACGDKIKIRTNSDYAQAVKETWGKEAAQRQSQDQPSHS